jgi:signal transduction histidine kinase
MLSVRCNRNPRKIATNSDRFDKLITALRTAVDNDGVLNKEATSTMIYLMHLDYLWSFIILEKVVSNLLDNAVKFTKAAEGNITIMIKKEGKGEVGQNNNNQDCCQHQRHRHRIRF